MIRDSLWFFIVLICILYSDVLLFLGWLGVVKSIQPLQTACQTLNTIFHNKLGIKCNSDEIVYINQITLNYLGKHSYPKAYNNSECQKTPASACFRSIPSDLPWNYTFYRDISKICNGNHNCTLKYNAFKSYVTKLCRHMDNYFFTRIGCFFECFNGKHFVFKCRALILFFLQ